MSLLVLGAGACVAALAILLVGLRWYVRVGLAIVFFALVAFVGPALARQSRDRAEAAVLKNVALIAAKEHQFREARILDADRDGVGEYGTLADLYRTRPPLIGPDLAGQQQFGYWFQVYLRAEVDDRETTFYVIAIPQAYAVTGRRCFVADAGGVIRAKDAGDRRREVLLPEHAADWPVVPTPQLR